MNNKKTSSLRPFVGGTSLLVIFAVLCLTVFALLTISTAEAERRLSDVSADAVSAYYMADLEAEEIFARLRNGELPEGITVDGSVYSYTCFISETQYIAVKLSYEDGKWTVISWQSVSTNT